MRLLVGATNAPIFPITTGLIEGWFPPGRWALPNAVTSSGLSLGQAALGPIVTALIVRYGWREAFYILAPTGVIVGALVVLVRARQARAAPGDHARGGRLHRRGRRDRSKPPAAAAVLARGARRIATS